MASRRNSLCYPSYFSAGYPVQFDATSQVSDQHKNMIQYKNVVKELEDAKL